MSDVVRSCPTCRDNLFTQIPSGFIGGSHRDTYWYYRCTNCGQHSKWTLEFPIPVCVGPPTYRDLLSLRMKENA